MRYTDPDLNYCPQCDEEYREDIVNCATCNISLISGSERLAMEEAAKSKMAARTMDISSEDELAAIRKGPLGDMKYLQGLLAAEKIPSLLAGEKGSCGQGCCGGGDIYLQIKVADGEEAMNVLAMDFKRTTALDSHDLSNVHAVFDTGAESSTCPACGVTFSTTSKTCPDCGLCF
ncbi:MAG: hypothetical protein K9K37_08515 [Desulfocapsa sp.]|nr:hypothetical protein [Desulfocapsa sp.]